MRESLTTDPSTPRLPRRRPQYTRDAAVAEGGPTRAVVRRVRSPAVVLPHWRHPPRCDTVAKHCTGPQVHAADVRSEASGTATTPPDHDAAAFGVRGGPADAR